MGRSIARLPEPGAPPSTGERRRSVRQKLHTPVYASFNGPQTGMVVDLSELLDLSEEGFAVQTAMVAQDVAVVDSPPTTSEFVDPTGTGATDLKTDRLEINQHVSLCLDLPETKSFVHGSGQVIWCDDTGRAGIRFAPLAPEAARTLKQWLFSNLLIGCANHSARKDQLAKRSEEQSVATSAAPIIVPEPSPAASISQRAELLSALDELRNQIRKITAGQIAAVGEHGAGETSTDRANAILQLITERAVALTGATGAALALEEDGGMICRARAGDPAPLLGSHVDVSQGVSGECVRTVHPILCRDTAADRRVDPELCRALGLGSFLAVPIVSDFRVAGLFEVFSPKAHAFSSDEITILQRLAELVPNSQEKSRAVEAQLAPSDDVAAPDAAKLSGRGPAPSLGDPKIAMVAEKKDAEVKEPEIPYAVVHAGEPKSEQPSPTTAATATLDHLRAVLWEHASELEEQARKTGTRPESQSGIEASPGERAPLEEASDDQADPDDESAAANDSEDDSEPDVRASTPIHHLGLLLCALAVLALALGYLLAPVIEKHLTSTAEATQSSDSSGTVQAATVSRTPLTPDDLRKLAEQGDSEAQFTLGTLYRNGDGVLQNDSKAVEWFQRAADQGHPLALRALGSAYWGGRGVEQNYSRAYFWYELALAMGDQGSKSSLEGLATQMTQRQVADARQQAEAWLQMHNQPPKTASN